MAAVMAAGPFAVLSHATAGATWELRRRGAGAVHVTVAGAGGQKPRIGVRVHRSVVLEVNDTTTHLGIPITTPLRTVLDLSAILRGRPLEHVLDLAEQRGLLDFAELRRRLAARPGGRDRLPYKRRCPSTPPGAR